MRKYYFAYEVLMSLRKSNIVKESGNPSGRLPRYARNDVKCVARKGINSTQETSLALGKGVE